MPNKRYINGRAKEYRIIKQLKQEGYPLVIRSAGSHGVIDIIAIKKAPIPNNTLDNVAYVRLVQSKGKTGYVNPKERQGIKELEVALGIEVEVL